MKGFPANMGPWVKYFLYRTMGVRSQRVMGRVKSYNTRKGQSLTGSGSSSSPTTQSTIIRLSRLDQVVVGCMERLFALQRRDLPLLWKSVSSMESRGFGFIMVPEFPRDVFVYNSHLIGRIGVSMWACGMDEKGLRFPKWELTGKVCKRPVEYD